MTSGFLLIHKEPGPSSAKVLNQVGWKMGKPKIGHSGTLDPFAEGLLVGGVGKATRLLDRVMAFPKTYEATYLLGKATDTLDITGEIKAQKTPKAVTPESLQQAVELLVSLKEQVPPMFSAIKQKGLPLYELARKGQEVPRVPRLITVYEAENLEAEFPRVSFRIRVSKGTYIRSFAENLASLFGQPVVLEKLVRTQSGPFDLANALKLEDITPETPLLPMDMVVGDLPRLESTEKGRAKVLMGQKLGPLDLESATIPTEGTEVAVFYQDQLLGLGHSLPHGVHVTRVLIDEGSSLAGK